MIIIRRKFIAYRADWKCPYCECKMRVKTPFGATVNDEYCPECGREMDLVDCEYADEKEQELHEKIKNQLLMKKLSSLSCSIKSGYLSKKKAELCSNALLEAYERIFELEKRSQEQKELSEVRHEDCS